MPAQPQIHSAADSLARQRRMAGSLRESGLRHGDRVALLTAGTTATVDLVLAASRSGVVPVPLDPRLTPRERAVVLDQVEPTLVVDEPAVLDALDHGPELDLDPYPRCRPMHFTSGTTGRPKGVWSGWLSPEHAEAAALEERALWGFRPDDLNLAVSPLYHSAPLRFAIGTLLAGGSVAVVPFEPAAVARAFGDLRPTTMFCVPAHLQRLFAHADELGERLPTDSFRLVAHAGAPCPTPVRLRAHDELGADVVWEFYGSTEGQFTACPATEWRERPGTLGRARPGRVVWTDGDDQIWCAVPPWARFEYWRDPDKTASAWTDSPDGPSFTVGDLGRVEDGHVFLDARRTDLVITGGVNVYPAEVEDVLGAVPGVRDVAVFGRQDDRWGQRVCAAWVGDATEEELRAVAAEQLAPPKRPKEYEHLEDLPRTATGKVRRTELA
ncbi:AMP-binding protein [Aeromicrobium sp.]|uniref:class I adenylate-forming enzyme family protein n=1 Tax=Aeromicrobium sp. TaxID=1871063 RepID=UPI0025C614FD|nr:AMP-binding protein [Aeromicrobium sp.]MCK5890694.1 AMP-binding protein [Aeromicrobium sp.]